MLELEVRALADGERDDNVGDWLAEGRLPIGCTVVTGLAGRPCTQRELEAPVAAVAAEYASSCNVCGADGEPGRVLWITLGPAARTEASLSQAVGPYASEVLVASADAKVGPELAEAIERALEDADDVRMVVVCSASAGTEGRSKMGRHVADLARVGRDRGCAVMLLIPLRKANAMCVEDPSTGIAQAADAVWKLYPAGETMKCFCTHASGGEAFDVAQIHKTRRSAPQPAPQEDYAGGPEIPEADDDDIEVVVPEEEAETPAF